MPLENLHTFCKVSKINCSSFFGEKLKDAFALQKLLTFFGLNMPEFLHAIRLKFNVLLTNNVVSFEQLRPGENVPQN